MSVDKFKLQQWSGQVQLSWDRGTAKSGLTTQTDTWLLSTGVSYTPNDKFVDSAAGGAVGMLTSGEYGPPRSCPSRSGICGADVAYDFGDDFVGALSLSAKLKFLSLLRGQGHPFTGTLAS